MGRNSAVLEDNWLFSLDSLPGVVFERGKGPYHLLCVEFAYLNSNGTCMYYVV